MILIMHVGWLFGILPRRPAVAVTNTPHMLRIGWYTSGFESRLRLHRHPPAGLIEILVSIVFCVHCFCGAGGRSAIRSGSSLARAVGVLLPADAGGSNPPRVASPVLWVWPDRSLFILPERAPAAE